MSRGVGKHCGFCEHWARNHKNDLTDISSIKIYLLDHCEDPDRKEDDYPNLKKVEESWEALATLILFWDVTNVMMQKPRTDLLEFEMGVVAGVSPGLFN